MEKVFNFIKKNIWFGIFFTLFGFILASNTPYWGQNTYSKSYYAINYFHGFVSRGFQGTIVASLFGNAKISSIDIYIAIWLLIFTVLYSLIFNALIKKYKYNKKIIFFCVLCVFSTFTLTSVFMESELGRFDMYIFILSTLSIIFIYKEKLLWLIPIFSVLGMLTHEAYLLAFSPLICMLLIYKYWNTKDKKWLIYLAINVVVLFGMYGVIKYANNHLPYKDAKEMYTIAYWYYDDNGKYPMYINLFTDYYFITQQTKVNLFRELKLEFDIRDYMLAFGGLIFTYVLYYFWIFKNSFKKANKYRKLIMIGCFLSTLTAFALFFVGIDHGRWMVFIVNSFLSLATFWLFDNKKEIIVKRDSNFMIFLLAVLLCLNFLLFNRSSPWLIKFDLIHPTGFRAK